MEKTKLKSNYKLNSFSIAIIVISLIIGMGIFKTPAITAAKAGTPTIFFLAWIICGFVAVCGALTYAQIGQMVPSIGGYFTIFSRSYPSYIAFTINILILISNAASLAIVAIIGSEYLLDLLPFFGLVFPPLVNDLLKKYYLLAGLFIFVFYLLNLLGLKSSNKIQSILMIFKIVLLLAIAATIFFPIQPFEIEKTKEEILNTDSYSPIQLLFYSLISVSFTYGGFQQTINFGGETTNPATYKKGIIWGIIIVLLIYLSVNYAYVSVIGFEKMKNAELIGSLMFSALLGLKGRLIFDFCMVIGVLAYVNIILLSNSRVIFAMSQAKLLPKIFNNYNAVKGVFTTALTAFSLLTILIIAGGKKMDDLLSFSIFIDCIGMISSSYTLFILLKKDLTRYKPNFLLKIKVLAWIFILYYFLVLVAICFHKTSSALTAIILLIVSIIVFKIVKKKSNSL